MCRAPQAARQQPGANHVLHGDRADHQHQQQDRQTSNQSQVAVRVCAEPVTVRHQTNQLKLLTVLHNHLHGGGGVREHLLPASPTLPRLGQPGREGVRTRVLPRQNIHQLLN